MKEEDWVATRDELMRLVAQYLTFDLFQLEVVIKLLFGCSIQLDKKRIRPPLANFSHVHYDTWLHVLSSRAIVISWQSICD